MHLAVAAGILLIHALAFALTPTGRAMASAWSWLKAKIAASVPKGIVIILRKKSRKGDELDLFVSTHDAETVARLLQRTSAPLAKQLPPALGGQCPIPPHMSANQLPVAAVAVKKRRTRRMCPQSSRRMSSPRSARVKMR